jgi:NAD(P)-dependent dehydrogenase (short-subunit alcohol dehydrogenase family)
VGDGKLWPGMGSWGDRVALISGASAGIGAATAVALGAKGCAVTLLARRRDRLEDVAGRVRAAGGRALVVDGDVTADDDVARAIDQTIAAFGHLDIVVANAGAGLHGSLRDTSPDAMARLMDLNYMGTFLLARQALPHLLRAPRASLIVVSSIVGRRGLGWGGAYAATKFAQVGLAESLRVELAGTAVRVGIVFPVSTETEFRDAMAREQGFAIEGHGPRQSADHVARAIVRGIERGRPEIHPHPSSKLLAILGVTFPGLADRLVRRYGRKPRATEAPR